MSRAPLLVVLVSGLALADDGTKVRVVSRPEGALVSIDDAPVGITPVDVTMPPGKHTVTVTLDGHSTFKKVLTKVTPGERISAELVDLELAASKQAVAKARTAYEKANAALERAQNSNASEAALAKAEAAMEAASDKLETTEKEQARVEKLRTSPEEQAAQAARLREVLNPRAAVTGGSRQPGSPTGRSRYGLVCTFDVGRNIEGVCMNGTLAQATLRCNAYVKTRGATTMCSCTDDAAAVVTMCAD